MQQISHDLNINSFLVVAIGIRRRLLLPEKVLLQVYTNCLKSNKQKGDRKKRTKTVSSAGRSSQSYSNTMHSRISLLSKTISFGAKTLRWKRHLFYNYCISKSDLAAKTHLFLLPKVTISKKNQNVQPPKRDVE